MKLDQSISLQAHAKDTPVVGTQTQMHGLPITIEHPRGTQRKLHDDTGKVVYKVHMHHSYGYFNKTKGRDGDEVDCFVGPIKDAKEVYIVHMKDMGPVPSEREDEDKCMVGFQSADAAKAAFLMHYPPSFYDGMTALPVALFKKKLSTAQLPHRKKKITADANGIGDVGDPAVAEHVRRMKRDLPDELKKLVKDKPALKAGGPGSGRYPVGAHVSVHFSPSIRTRGTVEGHYANGDYNIRHGENGNEMRIPASQVYDPLIRHKRTRGLTVIKGPAGKIWRQLQKPAMFSQKEGADESRSKRSGQSARSTFGRMALAAKRSSCPKCGGKKIVLMPTDYETAKCKDCGKTWQVTAPDVKAKATGLVKQTFTVEAKPDVMIRFQKFLSYVQWCCGVGHSTEVVMSVDGDGADAFYVKEKLPKFAESEVRTVKVTGEQLS